MSLLDSEVKKPHTVGMKNKQPKYSLSVRAEWDMRQIYSYGADQFDLDQADRYNMGLEGCFERLAENPRMGRERKEISAGVRGFPYHAHLILYEVADDGTVVILRIRNGREDWVSDPA